QPVRIADVRQEPRANHDLVRRLQARTLIIVPLISGGKTIGSISVINKTSGPFTGDDERVLSLLASGAVIGLEMPGSTRRNRNAGTKPNSAARWPKGCATF
ncbi:MAG: GAF domain-containing protein, partial [Chloroflexi bacterium]|nr:GAF domain-containing protein [Chloroflexota bacterium]